jgi:Holliday junction resolvase RusA-like endonuclease
MGSLKLPIIDIDFQTGIPEIIPSAQTANKSESEALKRFKISFGEKLTKDLLDKSDFPTEHDVFVFIAQYFSCAKEYKCRDIDNIGKTILDVSKNKLYKDDSQVKVYLVTKEIEARIKQNFAYMAVKIIKSHGNIDILKIAGIDRSITYYQKLKQQGLM